MLQVGPQSAGSEPGPICYGRGGTLPTITDANLVLGRLDPERLLAVKTPVTLAHVRAIFETTLARPLGLSVDEAAAAVIRLANTHMAGAIRMVSLSRGYDPRDFTLFAFGGAGPLHAVALAQELSLPEVLVPARPGLTNALGCLVADLRQDFVNTLNVPLDGVDMASVHATLAAQRERGIAINAEEQSEIVETQVLHGADMQFRGQTHLIRVTLPRADVSREEMQALFETAYFNRFQVRLPEIKAVLVNLVTSVIGRRRPFPMAALIDAGERAVRVEGAIIGERHLFARAAWQTAPVFDRVKLPIGARIAGPAIVQQIDATTLIEPGSAALVDEIGSLRIAVGLPA
jgi:N-methylhydantoinase A